MNKFILSNKPIPSLRKFHDAVKLQVPEFDGFNTEDSIVTVVLTVPVTQELIDIIEQIAPPSYSQLEIIQKVIADAINFGNQLISEFAAQNVLMGITQEGMTGTVRKNMSEVVNALSTGSLYDAIAEAKAIPSDKKDSKYITDARLLEFVNKIEAYLNIPLSNSL